MVGDPGVAGQPGDVEPEVGDLGPAIPRPAALPQGVDAGAELLQRVQHPDQRHPLWQGSRPSTLTDEQDSEAYCIHGLVRRIINRLVYATFTLYS